MRNPKYNNYLKYTSFFDEKNEDEIKNLIESSEIPKEIWQMRMMLAAGRGELEVIKALYNHYQDINFFIAANKSQVGEGIIDSLLKVFSGRAEKTHEVNLLYVAIVSATNNGDIVDFLLENNIAIHSVIFSVNKIFRESKGAIEVIYDEWGDDQVGAAYILSFLRNKKNTKNLLSYCKQKGMKKFEQLITDILEINASNWNKKLEICNKISPWLVQFILLGYLKYDFINSYELLSVTPETLKNMIFYDILKIEYILSNDSLMKSKKLPLDDALNFYFSRINGKSNLCERYLKDSSNFYRHNVILQYKEHFQKKIESFGEYLFGAGDPCALIFLKAVENPSPSICFLINRAEKELQDFIKKFGISSDMNIIEETLLKFYTINKNNVYNFSLEKKEYVELFKQKFLWAEQMSTFVHLMVSLTKEIIPDLSDLAFLTDHNRCEALQKTLKARPLFLQKAWCIFFKNFLIVKDYKISIKKLGSRDIIDLINLLDLNLEDKEFYVHNSSLFTDIAVTTSNLLADDEVTTVEYDSSWNSAETFWGKMSSKAHWLSQNIENENSDGKTADGSMTLPIRLDSSNK